LKTPVVILNWNGTADTILSVQSVRNQTHKDYHIYLADNGSEPEQREHLVSHLGGSADITFMLFDTNLGFAKAHNKVFKHILENTGADYIALLNNDAFAEPDWLAKMLQLCEKSSPGMVSCKMLFYEQPGKVNNYGHKMLNTGEILPIGWGESAEAPFNTRTNAGASGGACIYSCAMLRDIGMFDEYFVTGYEDAELGARAMVAGYKLEIEPNAAVLHKVGASISKIRSYNYALKLQLDIIYTYFKLMPIGCILANLPWVVSRTAVIIVLFALWGRWGYIKIFFHAWWIILSRDKAVLLKSRREFSSKRRLTWMQVCARQEFFLFDNFKRFITYFLKGEKTVFEKF
jgi:GT2 family glycosyltransferase